MKYHLGASGSYDHAGDVRASPSRPTRATSRRSTRWSRATPAPSRRIAPAHRPTVDPDRTIPILIHGDAAFAAQGVVAETFNMARLAGYSTGGTLHLIANNQVGFTTEPSEGRSTTTRSDLAKGFDAPIIHVNADDPEACLAAARLAMAYRGRVPRRRGDRPGRLPPLRAQRGRRAGLHASR